jgi:large conductance mechanosensitive channel
VSLFKEFRDFISRGNVIDLAVAFVVGAAFSAVVSAVVTGLVTPLVGAVFGTDYSDMSFTVNDSEFRYGIVLNAVIYFLVVSAVVFFFVVKPMNYLQERRRRGEEPVEDAQLSDEAVLLAEIRDLMASQAGRAGGGSSAGP